MLSALDAVGGTGVGSAAGFARARAVAVGCVRGRAAAVGLAAAAAEGVDGRAEAPRVAAIAAEAVATSTADGGAATTVDRHATAMAETSVHVLDGRRTRSVFTAACPAWRCGPAPRPCASP